MAIGIGLGIARFPFEDAKGYWRWVEQCEAGNVDSIWQTDRLISKEPMLECFAANSIWVQCCLNCFAGPSDRRQAMCHH